jgi:hypothetical protein
VLTGRFQVHKQPPSGILPELTDAQREIRHNKLADDSFDTVYRVPEPAGGTALRFCPGAGAGVRLGVEIVPESAGGAYEGATLPSISGWPE